MISTGIFAKCDTRNYIKLSKQASIVSPTYELTHHKRNHEGTHATNAREEAHGGKSAVIW